MLAIASVAAAATGSAQGESFLKAGDRWILSGDSITSTDTYRQILQLAIDHYHPGSGIVIGNRGVWGQKLSEEKRLDKEQPDVVSIMIAMNNFIHHEYGAGADFSDMVRGHVEGLRQKIREYHDAGTEVLLMTPTLTDEREGGFFVTYQATRGLRECGEAIRKLATEEGCLIVPVAEDLEAYLATLGPRETCIPDGVHPYGYGQYTIAGSFLRLMDFAGPLAGTRSFASGERAAAAELGFRMKTRFVNDPGEGLVFECPGVKGKLRWSLWCDSLRLMTDDDTAGHELARGEAVLDGADEWHLDFGGMPLNLLPGERARVMIDIVPEDGVSRLYCVDLATTAVVHMDGGKAEGAITTDKPRHEGPKVADWKVEEDGKDLWVSGFTYGDEPSRKSYGTWANVFSMNGLQVMFDFRPLDRFAGFNPDRDAPMVLVGIVEDPAFAVMPFVWMARRYQAALFANAQKAEGGYTWRIGFRGNITDCEEFDITRLDCFGMYLMIGDEEAGELVKYPAQPYSPMDNPERRMNQMVIFDRKGIFPGGTTITANFFAF